MSALVAGSVAYALQGKLGKDENGNRVGTIKLTFGDSALTYPTGGVPLSSLSSNGWPNVISAVSVIDAGSSGYVPRYDYANNKLMLFVSASLTPAGTVAAPTFTGSALAAHRHSLFVATGATDATGARANAATNSLAMNNAAATIAGIGAASGSAGGVVDITAGTPAGTNSAPAFTGTATSAAALAELASSVAPAAMSVYLRVVGY